MFVLDTLGREIQEANNLCWAAVATMAVRAFPEDAEFKHPTQRQTVIYRASDIATLAQLKLARDKPGAFHDKFERFQRRCEKAGSCNVSSIELHMFDLRSRKVPVGHALLPEHFFIEIALRGRPVPIRWQYLHEPVAGNQVPGSEHALIVTGYNPATNELRIFDPWPANDPDDDTPDLAPDKHEKWIPYNVYLDPRNDHGLDAVAKHEFDEYMLQRAGDPTVLTDEFSYPDPVPLPPRLVRRENSVDFARHRIPDDLNAAIDRIMRAHVVRKPNGDVIHGPYDRGLPIPVMALKISQICAAAHDTSPLFKSDTSTVAVPVLRNGELIDSFMMLHDRAGWHAGGYCNNQVTALLLEARKIHGEKTREPLYLVSIPELSAFYVGHGFLDRATIAGLSRKRIQCLQRCEGTFSELVATAERERHDIAAIRAAFEPSAR